MTAPAVAQQTNGGSGVEPGEPGRLLEQRERQERFYGPDEELEPDDPDLDVAPLDGGKLPEDSQKSFVLRAVRYDESEFIASDRLKALAAPYIGKDVTFADINDLVDQINAIYRERGLVTARAIVPPQRIEQGVLRIRLVEGKVGAVDFRGREYTRKSFVRSAVGLEPGETIDVPAVQRRLRGVNRLTPLQLGARLRAGEAFGESNVIVDVDEPPRWTGRVFVDNNGAESTGEEQAGVVAAWNGPLRRSDRLTGYVVASEGSASVSGTYSVPVLPRGDTLTLQLSHARTEIVDGGFAAFEIEGESTQASLEYRAPGLTFTNWSVDWLSEVGYVTSDTDALGDPIAETQVSELGLGLQARGGGKRWRWFVEQRALASRSENILNEKDRFVRYPGRLSLVGPGVFGGAFQASGTWQFAPERRIASPVEFSIGGVGTVRGYDSGIQAAARGGALSLEHHWRLDGYVDPLVFFDVGRISGVGANRETIRSVGAGFNWQGYGFSVNASVAHAIDSDIAPDQGDFRAHVRVSYSFGAGR
jgi:hemolysin activation/secretion protein